MSSPQRALEPEIRHSSERGVSRRAFGWAALPLLWPSALPAQPRFPLKPVTLIVPFAPGGIADITARTVADAMAAHLQQPVIVDNRPSAGGIVASAAVAQAARDGHTLLLMSNANAVSASLFNKLPFDVVKDFAPITTLGYFDLALFVGGKARFRQLGDVLAYAKAAPGRLTLGSIAVGSTQHLAAELFKIRAGIDALVVPYKGSPAVLTALRAGEIDMAVEILGPMLPQIEAGAVRALAVTSTTRHAALPAVPTAREAGVADFVVSSWNALAAPKGTPPAVIATLNQAATHALASPEVRQRLSALGVRAQAGTPAQLGELLVGEVARWAAVIRRAKIPTQ